LTVETRPADVVPGPPSRRDVLRLSSLALLGLAGCATRARDADGRDAASPTATEPTYSRRVDAPASRPVRNPQGGPAVRSSAHTPGEDVHESSASWRHEDWLVTTGDERDALSFSRAATGVDAATAFLADTDLSAETLLVHQYAVAECETRRLDRLEWTRGLECGDAACVGIRLHSERTGRDGDCRGDGAAGTVESPSEEDARVGEATFVRIPARIQSYGRFGYGI
jgi:hypothetical protein